ncbi:MAG: Cof-type HAD-IIB family hydrolase [Desulfitobacteriaceae bacterium]|nr:Cof-type HAD-IIB family hydrolase [Desulfitobacteriaceae bacterium]MDD4753364.1 Cof-type HAD-IIB family hydrolase [Desulfitobacteriaceae bacterium]
MHVKFKLIASDLDDTLLDSRGIISPRTKAAIKKAREKGVYVTLATGRMYRSAVCFAEELEIDVPLITYQGALVKTSTTREVMYHRPVPLELARQVIAHGEEKGLTVNLYVEDSLFVKELTPEAARYARVARVPIEAVGDLQKFLDQEPTKVLLIGNEKILEPFWTEEKEKFGESLYITKSKPYFLEYTHPQATKEEGLMAVARHLGVAREEIIAFGDNYNDIDLLRYAGFGVAMSNAPEQVKKEADYVTGSNIDEGVAEAIEKFVLS